MKKMTTGLAMIALAATLSTLTFGQTGKRNRRANFEIQGGLTKGRQTRNFDKGYLPPGAANGYTGATTVNQGLHHNFGINWGDGHNTYRSATVQPGSKTAQPNHFRVWDQTNGDSKPKSILAASTYGRGSFARSRGRSGR